MSAKASRLTIRLGGGVRAWLKAEGDKRGLDEAAFARMVIYRAMNGIADELGEAALGAARSNRARVASPVAPAPVTAQMENAEAPGDFAELADEPRAEEIEVPTDADDAAALERVDALMQAGPTFFDELLDRAKPRQAQAAAPRQPRQSLQQINPRAASLARSRFAALQPKSLALTKPDHRRGYGVAPGSLTRAVGINQADGNIRGDGFGNVLRDNMRHFGMVGTRSR